MNKTYQILFLKHAKEIIASHLKTLAKVFVILITKDVVGWNVFIMFDYKNRVMVTI